MIKEFKIEPMTKYPADLIIKFNNGMGFGQPITEMSKEGIADALIRIGELIKKIKQETFDDYTESL